MSSPPVFRQPTPFEKLFNSLYGSLVGIGLGFSYNYLLQVRGRKSGKLYSTPINRLVWNGRQYLVAPRGRAQWVRNAEAAGEITLKKGSKREQFRLRSLSETQKIEVLKAYLDTFKREVQSYFPISAGSPKEAFAAIADNYPAFELLPLGSSPAS
jgi:deazaflavin-dependent oxidoreductase (nitroreductase family)